MSRTLLVEGDKTFRIEIPDDAKLTYGPWAPPKKKGELGFHDNDANRRGTLRIYQADGKSIIACFAGVTTFRDLSIVNYSEMVARQEVDSVWKSDRDGYQSASSLKKTHEWIDPHKLIEAPKKVVAKKKK